MPADRPPPPEIGRVVTEAGVVPGVVEPEAGDPDVVEPGVVVPPVPFGDAAPLELTEPAAPEGKVVNDPPVVGERAPARWPVVPLVLVLVLVLVEPVVEPVTERPPIVAPPTVDPFEPTDPLV